MKNPTKPGVYSTVFRDGTFIPDNIFIKDKSMLTGETIEYWYHNSSINGGIVHWFEVPEGSYTKHSNYLLPDWELHDLIVEAEKYHALEEHKVVNEKALEDYLDRHGFNSFEQMADEEIRDYYEGYKY